MLSSIIGCGPQITRVELTLMNKDAASSMMSNLLCLSPRLTRPLSEIIFHKSKGNPLFFSQLMLSLWKDGLIWLSLSRRRWEWDADTIQSRKLPDDVAMFIMSSVSRLPKEVQSALSTLSCFGACTDCALVEALESKFGKTLTGPLEIAIAEGVLDKINGNYVFCHDRLQEAAYNLIEPENRSLFHFKYGVALVPLALEIQDDMMLFCAASQINLGGPAAVENAEQAVLIANLNLSAGQKAMGMSDYTSAYSFFDHGISFLRKRHWQEHYDLSMDLFEAASKCALAIGDLVSLNILSEQILTFAKTFEEKLNAMYNTVTALGYTSQLKESVKRSILILSQLGETIPESSSYSDVKFYMEQTNAMLKAYSNQALVEYKAMVDPKQIMAMKFYARLEIHLQMIKPALNSIVTMKMVQLSIAHGMSPLSPLGFTYFGQLLAAFGDIREGYRYVKIGRQLLERMGSKEVAGEVIAQGTQVVCCFEPVQAAVEAHVEGQTTAMAAGDYHFALYNSACYVVISMWAGVKLAEFKKRSDQALALMKERNTIVWTAHIFYMSKIACRLIGAEFDYATESQKVEDVREENLSAAQTYYYQNMWGCYLFREYKEMKIFAEKHFEFSVDLHSYTFMYYHSAQKYFSGLVAFWVYRESKENIWAERGRKTKFVIKKYADCNEWNFESKLALMEAEEASCYSDIDNAKKMYKKAILAAKKHRFIHEEALAYELAGHFFLKIEDKNTAIEHFMQAHEKYHQWGAVAKSTALFEFVRQVLGKVSTNLDSFVSPETTTSTDHHVDNGDKNERKRTPVWSAD